MSPSSFKLAVLCGGPSAERGISLNSARSLLDHLQDEHLDILPIYVDHDRNFYAISTGQLYSNTPSDFDFKLQTTAQKLDRDALIAYLRGADMVFPAMHGAFGEDGQIQGLLEEANIPFVGSPAQACREGFDKYLAARKLADNGFAANITMLLDAATAKKVITDFFAHHPGRAVIKPAVSGSSIGVHVVNSAVEAEDVAAKLLDVYQRLVIEPFCQGREFSVVVLHNEAAEPVALIPSEIQINTLQTEIFDYRKKYLPTGEVHYHCPPRFESTLTQEIRSKAGDVFRLFGLRDMARIDGWVLEDGRILFTDINPISGMEQNSFLFIQSTRVGLSHRGVLRHVLGLACKRHNVALPAPENIPSNRLPVKVLFGGNTAERQVSLMSGSNVWLKLCQSHLYAPTPHLLDPDGQTVWELPYTYVLNHTVEEIAAHCARAAALLPQIELLAQGIRKRLGLAPLPMTVPRKLDWDGFTQDAAFVFLGLHGGAGEDGTLQARLAGKSILFNGSGEKASALCMDKYATGVAVRGMNDPTIETAPKERVSSGDLIACMDYEAYWAKLCEKLQTTSCIIKPADDGCSAGVIRLNSARDLHVYAAHLREERTQVAPNTFKGQTDRIEMPQPPPAYFLIESFIATDPIRITGTNLSYTPRTGWLELTAGVYEKDGALVCMNPSITIAEGAVLSLEEKFQGGTGVNITPPPADIIAPAVLASIKDRIGRVAKALGIGNYARIDFFYNKLSDALIIIEANSLPGLTPSTVIYHQALAEIPSLTPRAFLEHLVETAGYAVKKEERRNKA